MSYRIAGIDVHKRMLAVGSRPMALLGYPRGHRIDPETRCCLAAHGA